VLLVDDEPVVLRSLARNLTGRDYEVEACFSAEEAIQRVARGGVQVVVSDISMPGASGLELLRMIREHDLELPVVLMTGLPGVESATEAIEYGAFKYVVKPVDPRALRDAVDRAARLYRLARAKREALELAGGGGVSDRAGLELGFGRALGSLWIAFQPIVRASDRSIFGYEALLRSDEPSLPGPGHVLDAAERLGQLSRLGRAVRAKAAQSFRGLKDGPLLFLNLHPRDLEEAELLDGSSALTSLAHRVVLEVTERSSVGDIENIREKARRLRAQGFRIAVDDLGAGYAGLASFALLEPEIVKLDMTLVRDIDSNPVKQKLVGSMTQLSRDLGLEIVAEGVETAAERDVLQSLGCDLFQGYLFARPGRPFPVPQWGPETPIGTSRADPEPVSGTYRVAKALALEAPVISESVELIQKPRDTEGPVVPLRVLDDLGEGITLAGADGRIRFSNRAADRILGVAAASGPPDDWADHYGVFLPNGQTRFPTDGYPLVRALAGEETNNVEMLVRNPHVPGGVLISVTGRPLRDDEGHVVGAAVVFRDVTALRGAEQALRAARLREKELAAFLVHDLKSPLTGMISTAELLMADPDPTAVRELAEILRETARSMHRMVMDLLDVHVSEDGTLVPEPEELDLADLLADVRKEMAQSLLYKNQVIQLQLAAQQPLISADRQLLRRVLQNLVDNCIKYGPRGGSITLELEPTRAGEARISVSDEGPGVPEELRDKIFEKYAKVEREASRGRDSRGLGLRFCRLAVEAHGGRIWVENREPRGARFCVELPRQRPAPTKP
jgi:EAL domain-containing protein (putative c-di-GMP-specific phosphodiesterase class I)/signal transduction histidine kinase